MKRGRGSTRSRLALFGSTVLMLVSAGIALATVTDAPHNETNDIRCSSCHTYSLWWAYSPAAQQSDSATVIAAVCMTCHDGTSSAPKALTHSSAVIGSTNHGTWGVGCTDCHNPHYQDQLRWAATEANTYLVTGTIADVTYNGSTNETTIAYTEATTNSNWPPAGAAPTDRDWTNKSLENANRGLILVHDTVNQTNTFSIVGATADQVVVKGVLGPGAVGNTFGLIFGDLIRDTIASRSVKFFDPQGGFVEPGANTTGICQVCHTQTNVYTNSGELPSGGSTHVGRDAMDCTLCHKHATGLKAEGHDGVSFAWAGNCATCHNPTGAQISITDVIHGGKCSLCHVNPGGSGARKEGDPLHGVDGSALEGTNHSTCVDCHIDKLGLTGGDIHHLSAHGYAAAGNCTQCHANSAGKLAADHSTAAANDATCAACHLNTAGTATGMPVDAADDTLHDACTTCHHLDGTLQGPYGKAIAMPEQGGSCLACHGDYFLDHLNTTNHDSFLLKSGSSCVTCHDQAGNAQVVNDIHGNDCTNCHDPITHALINGTTKGVKVSGVTYMIGDARKHSVGTTSSCAVCHSYNPYLTMLANHPSQNWTHLDNVGDEARCLGCHAAVVSPFTDAGEVHNRNNCATCHHTTGGYLLKGSALHHTIGQPSSCSTCHPAAGGGTHHSGSFTFTATCLACHSGADVVTDVHRNDCGVCHSDSANPSRDNEQGSATPADGTAAAGTWSSVSCLTCHPTAAPDLTAFHHDRIASYQGAATCLACHQTSSHGGNLLEDVMLSAHFQLRTPSTLIDIPGGGSHGMVDRACGLPGTTMMANNYAGVAVSPVDGALKSDGCGKCHIAKGMPGMYYDPQTGAPNLAKFAADVDCLICHAATYGAEWPDDGSNPERTVRQVIVEDGRQTWAQDRSLMTAKTIGKVTNHACDRCHEHGMGPYKRNTPIAAADDVHVAKGVACLDCHLAQDHKIARGKYMTDGAANERPEVAVLCTNCHAAAPHNAANAAALNLHATNVSCEACHVTELVEQDSIYRRSWGPFTMDPTTGSWEDTPATTTNPSSGIPNYFDAYTEFKPAGEWPTLRWFDGRASMLAQSYAGFSDRVSAGGEARLMPFKLFVSGMLFDANWLQGQWLDPTNTDPVTGTRIASMKMFYELNWDKFKGAGFVEGSYATAADYWAARPDMARMLNNFPMMLQFDRAIYLSQAGNVVGSPTPGPQSAATYPGVARAINSGMGRMAVDMGYAPQGSDLEQVGATMWSGTFFAMWVPPEMNPQSPFLGELGSLITVSHAIKGKDDPTLSDPEFCYSCHLTAEENNGTVAVGAKRLDLAKLGYSTDPFYAAHPADFGWSGNCSTCHSGTGVVASIHHNDCNLCHNGTPSRDNEKGAAANADGTAASGTWSAVTCATCHSDATITAGPVTPSIGDANP